MTTNPEIAAPAETSNQPARRGAGDRQPLDVLQKYAAAPEHQLEALRWLHAHGIQHDLSMAELARLIDYDKAVISRLYSVNGVYTGSLDAVCDAINAARERIEEEAKCDSRRLPFTESSLSRHIWKLCDMARDYERMLFMYGESQMGKSTNLKEKTRREKGSVFYWEMPVGGGFTDFLANAAEALGMSAQRDAADLRRAIIRALRSPTKGRPFLIIIDQMHRAFSDAKGNLRIGHTKSQIKTLDFIIELFDDCRKGIVLAGTPVFREGMDQLAQSKFFVQLKKRGLNEEGFPLPSTPSVRDLNTFAKAYGLAPATGAALVLQTRIIKASGLGVWLTRLSMGAQAAKKKKKEVTWENVIGADDFLAAAAQGRIAIEEGEEAA